MMPQSAPKQAPWNLTQFSQSPSAALSYFPESHWWSEISSLSKVILVLGKARSCRVPNQGCRGSWVTWMIWCFTNKFCLRCDAWAGILWWSCQSPVAHGCGLLNHQSTFRRRMFKLNAKFDVDSLLYSLGCFECDGHTVHMLTQQCPPPPLTGTVKPSLLTHVHSSPLSLAARLHWCCTNCSRRSNNGWTFSRIDLVYVSVCML